MMIPRPVQLLNSSKNENMIQEKESRHSGSESSALDHVSEESGGTTTSSITSTTSTSSSSTSSSSTTSSKISNPNDLDDIEIEISQSTSRHGDVTHHSEDDSNATLISPRYWRGSGGTETTVGGVGGGGG